MEDYIMEQCSKYLQFLELRDRYPKYKNLIADLMHEFMVHDDVLPRYFSFWGNYAKEDVQFIFNELGISTLECSSSTTNVIRPPKYQTNVFLAVETRLAD